MILQSKQRQLWYLPTSSLWQGRGSLRPRKRGANALFELSVGAALRDTRGHTPRASEAGQRPSAVAGHHSDGQRPRYLPKVHLTTPPWTLGRREGPPPTTTIPWTFAAKVGGGGGTLRVPPWQGTLARYLGKVGPCILIAFIIISNRHWARY